MKSNTKDKWKLFFDIWRYRCFPITLILQKKARNSKVIVELAVQKEILFKCDWTVRGEHINLVSEKQKGD